MIAAAARQRRDRRRGHRFRVVPSSGCAVAMFHVEHAREAARSEHSSRSTTMTSEDWPGDVRACSADMLFLPASRGAPVGSGQAPSQYGGGHRTLSSWTAFPRVANAVLWTNAVYLFHVKRHLRRRITTTVVGDASKSTPHNTTRWSTPPSRADASRCSSSSCAPRRPFSANRCPPVLGVGSTTRLSDSNGATARAVTQATGATRRTTARSSARRAPR